MTATGVADFLAVIEDVLCGQAGRLSDRLRSVPELRRFFSVVGSGLRLPVEVGVNRADVERLASGLKGVPLPFPLILTTPALVPSTDEMTD